jgi:multidrug efflux pump subunit AcrB
MIRYLTCLLRLSRLRKLNAQADNPFRLSVRDVENLKTRNNYGDMVPIGSVARFRDTTGPFRVPRYNLYPAAEVRLSLARGFSSGQAIAAIEKITQERLPQGFGFEWTEIALQEKLAGNTASIAFGLAVTFVFLLCRSQRSSLLCHRRTTTILSQRISLSIGSAMPRTIAEEVLGANLMGVQFARTSSMAGVRMPNRATETMQF